ncbi:MAG: NUDIX domain-containing protein [Bacteroidales bacterium]
MINNIIDQIGNPEIFIQQVSIDCVIFGFHGHQLKVLLPKLKGLENKWTLPGGYIMQNEAIDSAAQRILKERTGLKDIYLEQFSVFGNTERNTYETMKKFLENNGSIPGPNHWSAKRFISIGYYALVDFTNVKPTPSYFDEFCDWYEIKKLPDLAFDHAEIIDKALSYLQQSLDYKLVGLHLMPEEFTMKELQVLYETILDKPLRRDNFQRKMLSLNILERLDKKYTGAANKAPYLYRFKTENQN